MSFLSAPLAARTTFSAGTAWSRMKAKSRSTAWNGEGLNGGRALPGFALGRGTESRNTSNPAIRPSTPRRLKTLGSSSPKWASVPLPRPMVPERPG